MPGALASSRPKAEPRIHSGRREAPSPPKAHMQPAGQTQDKLGSVTIQDAARSQTHVLGLLQALPRSPRHSWHERMLI